MEEVLEIYQKSPYMNKGKVTFLLKDQIDHSLHSYHQQTASAVPMPPNYHQQDFLQAYQVKSLSVGMNQQRKTSLSLNNYARNGTLTIVKQPNRYSKLFTAYSHNNKRSVPVVRVVPDPQ